MTKRLVPSLAILIWRSFSIAGLCLRFSGVFSGYDCNRCQGKVMTGKIYMKGTNKIRQEVKADGEVTVTILRLDKNLDLMPEKQYMEVAFPLIPTSRPVLAEMKTIGNETAQRLSL